MGLHTALERELCDGRVIIYQRTDTMSPVWQVRIAFRRWRESFTYGPAEAVSQCDIGSRLRRQPTSIPDARSGTATPPMGLPPCHYRRQPFTTLSSDHNAQSFWPSRGYLSESHYWLARILTLGATT